MEPDQSLTGIAAITWLVYLLITDAVAGTSPFPVNWFDKVNETEVLAGQREFLDLLGKVGFQHERHEELCGHTFRGT